MPKLSVIIPVYNVEKYLAECLDSVLAQTLRDMEIICVDDGSTDGSPRILAEYAAKDSRIRVITQKNGGQSVARNTGMAAARGKYLYSADSDDVLKGDCLGRMLDLCEKNDTDILEFIRESFYEPGMPPDPYEDQMFDNGDYPDVLSGPEMFVREARNRDFSVYNMIRIYSADFYREAKLEFHPGLSYCEDEAFVLIATLSAKRIMRVHDVCYRRRVRPGSVMTGSSAKRKVIGCLTSHDDIEAYLLSHDLPDDAVREVRRRLAGLLLTAGNAYSHLTAEEAADIPPYRGKPLPEQVRDAAAFLHRCEVEDEMNGRSLWQRLLSPLRCLRENGLRYTLKRIFKGRADE